MLYKICKQIKDKSTYIGNQYKSSAVAETGNRGHNRHWPNTGGSCCAPFAENWDPV